MKNNTQSGNGRLSAIILVAIIASLLTLSGVVLAQNAVPDTRPDGAQGAVIFTDRCIACHGVTGEGDGEMADRLEVPPQAFTDPEYRKTAVPATMFTMITNGDIAAGMPPFGPDNANGPIAEQDRWHLIATVYSLATPPDALERGTAVYDESCLQCHGNAGDGVAGFDLSDYSYWVSRSNEEVFNAIENGAIADHAYELSDEQRWDVVDTIRTFGYTYNDPIAAAQPIADGSVYGNVSNATTGEIVAEGEVILRAYDMNFEETLRITTTIATDGSYEFALTAIDPTWIFMAGITYRDLSFTGPVGNISSGAPALEVPITVFDSTTDASALHIGQQHNIIAFAGENLLSINEIYTVINDGTAVFIGEDGSADSGTVHYFLPEGAQNVDFARSFRGMENSIPAREDMVQIGEYEWADTLAVRPGTSQSNLIIHYEMAYDGGADLSRTIGYPTDHINLILPDNGVVLQGDQWTFVGAQDMGAMGSFVTYEQLNVAAETAVGITIEGEPQASTGGMTSGGVSATGINSVNLLIGALALLLVGGGAAYFIISSRKSDDEYEDEDEYEDDYEEDDEEEDDFDTADNAIEVDALVKQLAAIDIAYEAGEIEETAYQEQRAALKEKLKAIW